MPRRYEKYVLLDPSGLSTRTSAPVMLAACARVNRISVELTTCTRVIAMSPRRGRDRALKPTPRTDTTVPAGNTPPPGMTSEIATLPPTVTMPGDTRAGTSAPDRFQSDEASSVKLVRLPTAASCRTRSATVRSG